MKYLIFILSFLLGLTLSAEQWKGLKKGASPKFRPFSVKVIEQNKNYTVLSVSVSGYYYETLRKNGKVYKKLSLHAGELATPGAPQLPFISDFIAIPWDNNQIEVKIIDRSEITESNVTVFPAQKMPKRCGKFKPFRFFEDKTIYSLTKTFPSNDIIVEKPAVFRKLKVVQFKFFPIKFVPSERKIVITHEIKFKIVHKGSFFFKNRNNKISPTFYKLYKNNIKNFNYVLKEEKAVPDVENLLIIAPDDMVQDLNEFVEWKNQEGIKTEVVPLSEIGTTNEDIKSYLNSLYQTSDNIPEFLILVGDVENMPTNHGNDGCASDFIYSQLSGDDLISDILVSRISAQTKEQLQIQLKKFIDYEKNPATGNEALWYKGSVCISSSQGSGESNDDYRSDIVCGMQKDYGYSPTDKFYHSQGNDTAENISAALNEGRSFVTYMGHGSGTSWATTVPEYSVDEINNLTNYNKLPVIMDVSCSNGGFDVYPSCFAETWLRANKDGVPTGAVGIYSSSTPTAWDEPAIMAVGAVQAFTQEGYHRLGEIYFEGRMYLMKEMGSGGNVEQVFQQYVVFGDSSLLIRSKPPYTLKVTKPDVVPVGSTTEKIKVTTNDDAPIKNALVCIQRNDEFFFSAYTDENGEVKVNFDIKTPGEINITVTAFDAVPYFGTIEGTVTGCGILKIDKEYLSCNSDITLTLWDKDLNINPGAKDDATIKIKNSANGKVVSVNLKETAKNSNKFQGKINIGTVGINPSNGATINLIYDDADCKGSPKQVKLDFELDCKAPKIFGIKTKSVTATGAIIEWKSDEKTKGVLFYGKNNPDQKVEINSFLIIHENELEGLSPETTYHFYIKASDKAGNETVNDNGGNYFDFTTPACTPDCEGKECGDDGCGGSCGECGEDQECNQDGKCTGGAGCEPLNQPGCNGCKCESCVCDKDPYCCQSLWDDICVQECINDCGGCGSCVPNCEGKECGDDGCGGSCGECPEGEYCWSDGTCKDQCEPQCIGKECGDDGCGGTCGECQEGFSCVNGKCMNTGPGCVESPDPGCNGCECEECVCSKDPYCCETEWDAQCVEECKECGGCSSCVPQCEGKECGDDGCGGTCGECQDGLVCNLESGKCVSILTGCEVNENGGCDGCPCEECVCSHDPYCCNEQWDEKCIKECKENCGGCQASCVPDCSDKECGDDGCGGNCGYCPPDLMCKDHKCVEKCFPDCTDKQCGDDGCGGSCGVCGDGFFCNGIGKCQPEFKKEDVAEEHDSGFEILINETSDTFTVVEEDKKGESGGGCSYSENPNSNSSSIFFVFALLALLFFVKKETLSRKKLQK